MNRNLITNIFSSFVDRAFVILAMFGATILMIRFLPREDYGIIGVVAGYGAFVQVVNIALENVILKEHKEYQENIEKYLLNFIIFSVAKSLIFLVIGIVLAMLLPSIYSEPGFYWAVLSLTLVLVGDSIISPLVLYASTQYKQKWVTIVNVVRYSLNVVVLFGLIYWPSLSFVFVKDIIITLSTLFIWWAVARYTLSLDFSKVSIWKDVEPKFMWTSLTGYSFWVHMTAVATNFIYRSDTIFLSFFCNLNVIGNYNVALTCANTANIAPAILGYHNSVGVSHAKTDKEAFELTDKFLRLSIYVGFITLLGFLLLGNYYLQVVTGERGLDEVYWYLICIVAGLVLVKTIASPFVAYINVKGDVKRLFFRVNLPALVFTAVTYFLSAKYFGAVGVAVSNIIDAVVWGGLLWIEIRYYGYALPSASGFISDIKWIIAKIPSLSGAPSR